MRIYWLGGEREWYLCSTHSCLVSELLGYILGKDRVELMDCWVEFIFLSSGSFPIYSVTRQAVWLRRRWSFCLGVWGRGRRAPKANCGDPPLLIFSSIDSLRLAVEKVCSYGNSKAKTFAYRLTGCWNESKAGSQCAYILHFGSL